MIPTQVSECLRCDELPPALADLILHNFQAKYVCYHKQNNTVEVGIEKQESLKSYPEITSQIFKLEEAALWLGSSFRTEDQDLRFYAHIIASNGYASAVDDVILV